MNQLFKGQISCEAVFSKQTPDSYYHGILAATEIMWHLQFRICQCAGSRCNYSIKCEWLLWNRFFKWKLSIRKNRSRSTIDITDLKSTISKCFNFQSLFLSKEIFILMWGIDTLIGFETQTKYFLHQAYSTINRSCQKTVSKKPMPRTVPSNTLNWKSIHTIYRQIYVSLKFIWPP